MQQDATQTAKTKGAHIRESAGGERGARWQYGSVTIAAPPSLIVTKPA